MSDTKPTPAYSSKQISHLRGLAQSLSPVVMVGNNGLTEKVLNEIEVSLKAHELIKIKIFGDDRNARIQMLEEICNKTAATAIHHIGKQLVIYRATEKSKEKSKIVLPQ